MVFFWCLIIILIINWYHGEKEINKALEGWGEPKISFIPNFASERYHKKQKINKNIC